MDNFKCIKCILNVFYQQVGDVRVQFFHAGLSGKPGSGSGDPIKVSFSCNSSF